MILTDLPPDVFNEITTNLAKMDHKSMGSLALVSRALRRPSQRVIFSCVTLTIRFGKPYDQLTPPRHFTLLRDILKANPELATYVRTLQCIQIDTSQFGMLLSSLGQNLSAAANQWMIDHGDFVAELFELLKEAPLQAFSIINSPRDLNIPLSWSTLNPTLQRSLFQLFSSPTFSHVSLTGMTLPRNIFNAFKDVKDVYLALFSWEEDSLLLTSDVDVDSSSKIHKPTMLGIQGASTPAAAAIGPEVGFDLSEISELTLDLTRNPLLDVTRFISLPNLKDLVIEFSSRPEHRYAGLSIDLGSTQFLHSLRISAEVAITAQDFAWLHTIFSTLPSTSHIQRVSLQLKLNFDEVRPTDLKPFDDQFEDLGKTLSEVHKRFPLIKRIHVKLGMNRAAAASAKETLSAFWERIRLQLSWKGCEGVFVYESGGDS